MELKTNAAIDAALTSGEPNCVIGLNGRGLVQLQLPAGCDYVVFTAGQAREAADLLRKHADRAGKPNPGNIQHNHSAGSWACPHPDCDSEQKP